MHNKICIFIYRKSKMSDFLKKIYTWAGISLILLAGITSCNIFHFVIEDYYQTEIIKSILFGTEYAVSQSVLTVSSICYLALVVLRRTLKIESELGNTSKKLLVFLALCCAISIFIYLSLVVHGFFSGKSEPGGLLRVITTVSFSGLGLFFISNRLNDYSKLAKWRNYCESAILLAVNAICICLTLQFASPKKMADFRHDLTTLSEIKNFTNATQKYFSRNGKLPLNSEQLRASGYLKEYSIDLQKIHYLQKADNTFSVSAVFLTSSKDFRRVYANKFFELYSKTIINPFEKGRFAFTYQLNKNSNKGNNSVNSILISSNIVIQNN